MRRVRAPALESLFVATFALLGFRLGTVPIRDNSAFLHLRTGIDIARGGGIPRVDPYSFTASGEPWVVQSWLAELTYGLLHEVGGVGLVVLQQGLLMGALAWLIARLARTGTPVKTAAAAAAAVAAGGAYWTPRPLLFGLLALAALITIVEGRRSIWWLLPIVWLWVNTHGSFALGLAWLLLRAVGEALDARDARAAGPALRYAGVFLVGLAAAVINPLGPRLLGFLVTVADKRSALQDVVEWRSPDFGGAVGLVSLAGLMAVAGVLMVRRAGFVDALPVLGFVAAGLIAQRNLAAAGVVAAPALARALRTKAMHGQVPERPRVHVAIAAVLVFAAGIFAVDALGDRKVDDDEYPVEAVRWLEDEGFRRPDARLAHQDYVGGWLILRDGRDARVFIDDRVDMYPRDVSGDYIELLRGRPGAQAILDRYDIDVVLWQQERALSSILDASDDWRRRYTDDEWAVFVREGGGSAESR